jgi:hypothetical protein
MPGPHEEFADAVRRARAAAEESFEAWLSALRGLAEQVPGGGAAGVRPWDCTVAFEMTVRTSAEASHTETGEWRLSTGIEQSSMPGDGNGPTMP